MAAICTSADGQYIFIAVEDASGFQIILRALYSDTSNWLKVYEPGAGTAANIAPVPSSPDEMIFFGNFGTDLIVLHYQISTNTITDISPASLGAKIINTLEINPSDPLEMWATVGTDEDLISTIDGGSNWTTLNAALGYDATALDALWSGAYELDRGFVGGDPTTAPELTYTPNEGAGLTNLAGAALATAADIVSIEATEAEV